MMIGVVCRMVGMIVRRRPCGHFLGRHGGMIVP